MKVKLTPAIVFIGILIFCKELLLTSILRVILIGYVIVMSILVFPLCAGILLTILIVTIPIAYLSYSFSAFILGLSIAIFLIIFRDYVLKKNLSYLLFSIFMAPCAVALGMVFLEPTYQLNWILEWVNMLSTTQTNVNDKMYEILILIKGIVVLMIFISIGGIFYGGSAVAVILNREILEQLLAPPKSVRKQLYTRMNIEY